MQGLVTGIAIASCWLAQQQPQSQPAVFRGAMNWQQRVEQVRREPASSTQKQLYIAFLKRRYSYQIAAVNDAYKLDASAFTELESSDFASVPRELLAKDDIAFAAEWIGAEAEDFSKALPKGAKANAEIPPRLPDEIKLAIQRWIPLLVTRGAGT